MKGGDIASALLRLTPQAQAVDAWMRELAEVCKWEGGAVAFALTQREAPNILFETAVRLTRRKGRTDQQRAAAAADLILQWQLRSLEVST